MNRKAILKELNRYFTVTILFVIFGLGTSLAMKAMVGVGPWDVFHQGISYTFGIPVGTVGVIVGIVIIFLSLFINIYPGIATLLNTVVIGFSIDFWMSIIQLPDNDIIRYVAFLVGITMQGIMAATYLVFKCGAGPRDSFIIGMIQRFQLDVTIVKPIVEGCILLFGILLGGNFGIGTFVTLIYVPIVMDKVFNFLNFDVKSERQENLVDQYNHWKRLLKRG